MSDYKDSTEWKALNEIWKSMSQEDKEKNKDNFKIVAEYLKNSDLYLAVQSSLENKATDAYSYLNELSPKSKNFVIGVVNAGDKNIYHSIMAIIESRRDTMPTVDSLWLYYSNRFGVCRRYILDHEEEVREIISLCLSRMERKGIIHPKNGTDLS